jgi:hypothetical protein
VLASLLAGFSTEHIRSTFVASECAFHAQDGDARPQDTRADGHTDRS